MTGIAYDALLAEAEERYPSFPITFPDGIVVELRSSLDLNDAETEELNTIQTRLTELDETSNVSELRETYLDALALIAKDGAQARIKFTEVPLKAIVLLFEKYNENTPGATKSEGPAPASS